MIRFKSIKSTLLRCFLIISLIPMVVIGWYGYHAAITSISQVQNSELDATTQSHVQLVKDWFQDIERDLNAWADMPIPKQSLRELNQGWKESGAEYKTTEAYKRNIKHLRMVFKRLQYHYEYVHDIFIIDRVGNIVAGLQKEDYSIGNLQYGNSADTLLALAYRQTLEDGKSHFSDLEYAETSKKVLSGYVTAPIRDHGGDILGVIVLQLNMGTLIDRLEINEDHFPIHHYLVGSDGLLRTNRGGHGILTERINTQQFWKWNDEHASVMAVENECMHENATQYIGPDGVEVIGKHYDIPIMGVHWGYISEISLKDALQPSSDLAKIMMLIIVIGIGVIIMAARVLSKRLTDPIIELRKASRAYASGAKNFSLSIKEENEIGELAIAFSDMVAQQQKTEQELIFLAEKEKQKSAESLRLSQVVGQSPYPMVITDTEGNIEYINAEMLHISGYTEEELIGKNMSIFCSEKHSGFVYQILWNRISIEQKVWHGTLIDRMKNGEYRDWNSTIFPLFDSEGRITNYVSIVKDVTDINAKERLLLVQSRQAQMGEMLSMIAHQWRQPLAIINALVGRLLLKQRFQEQSNEETNTILKQIEDQSLFLSDTITDFRDFFRIDKPQEFIACSELIHNTMNLIDYAIKSHALQCTITVKSDPLIYTYTNEVLQVFITLIKNSLDAFEEHRIVEKSLQIVVDQEDDWAVISVIDNAGGIESHIMEEIFSPYFTTKEGDKGTGLGLYMAKIVIEEHCKGSISVQSSEGTTTFKVFLPLKGE